jgi:hypothetical protein
MLNAFVSVNGRPTIDKDPSAVLDYLIDFTAWLAAVEDTIVLATVAVAGVELDNYAITEDETGVRMWVSGGTVGEAASATAHIVTDAGREDDRTIYFRIKER